ncbi:hypothetical protein J43TS9_44120 [Paenibacillus cineris]|nr:hypothetical protein J43TS9_44120 [Paenibacillus cineris]
MAAALTQWYEPTAKNMLDRYEWLGEDIGTYGTEYSGVSPTSYKEGIASTIKSLMAKHNSGY